MPVAGDGLVSFRAFEGLLGGVVRPGHGEVSGEGPDLFGLVTQAGGEPRKARDYDIPVVIEDGFERMLGGMPEPVR